MTDLLQRLEELPEARRAEVQRRLLERARARKSGSAEPEEPGGGVRPGLAGPGLTDPSYAQERLWFLEQLDPGRATYHIPAVVHLTGEPGLRSFFDAWGEVRRRHEPLRTDFPAEGGRPRQRVRPAGRKLVPVADLTHLEPEDRRGELQRLTDATVQRPFRIDRRPPVRARWVRTAPRRHAFLLTLHHLVADGASVGILVGELSSTYRSFRSGSPSSLDAPEIRYADWAVWQRRRQGGPRIEASRTYWRERLEDLEPLLPLPTDRPRPAVARHRGRVLRGRLDGDTTDALTAIARSGSTTLFAALAACFAWVLHRWSGAREVPLGVPVAGRRDPRVHHLVGLFVDTVVLRPDLSGDPGFVDLLDRLRTETLGAFSHQEVPFERLVEDLGVPRSRSHAPIFQVLLTLNEAADRGADLPGVELELEEPHSGTAKFDLTLTAVRRPNGPLDLTLEADRDLFDATTVRRLLGRFRRFVEAAVESPRRPLRQLPFSSDPERHLLTREWAGPEAPVETFLLHEGVFAQAARNPEMVAVVDGARRVSYGELAAQARDLARRLRHLEVGPETVVGLYAGRSVDAVAGMLGILAAGGAYLPLDPDYPTERVELVLEDAGASWVVTTEEHASSLPGGRRVVLLGEASDDLEAPPPPAVSPDRLAYVVYTSGSTGRPKGVAVTHAQASRLWAATGLGFGPDDVWTLFHSPAFDFSVWEVFGALLHGGRLVVVPYLTSRSPGETVRLLADEAVTVLSQTPSAFLQLQDAETALGEEAPGLALRRVVFGGEALQPSALQPWIARHGDGTDGQGPELVNMYGITETTVHVTRRLLRRDDVRASTSPLGRPLADLSLHLLEPGGLPPVPLGAAGEIGVGGAGLARGYLGRPAETARRFVPNPWGSPGSRLYRSGDLARYGWSGDPEYLGRLDHQVQLRGFRVELGEIEATLEGHPGVSAAVVVPASPSGSGARGGRVERLAAWIRPVERGSTAPIPASEIRTWLAERLPDYMVPSLVYLRGELPTTPSGKIDRQALVEATREARPETGSDAVHVPPETPVELVVASIWCDVLELDRVGLHDDFFALGGHSLLATRVVSRLQEAFGANLPVAALFEAPTVAGLAERLESSGPEAPPRLPPVTRGSATGPQPLSASQLREWFLDRMSPGNPAYHVTAALRFDGHLAAAPLQQAFGEVVRRHETLRTVFPLSDPGDPVQEVRSAASVPLPRVDLSALSSAHRETVARSLARAGVERPFDLAGGPVVRWRWLQLASRDVVLSWVVHHVAADGWSLGVITREMDRLYDAYTRGRPSDLAELPVRYVDYAHTQRDFLDGPGGEALAAAWKERLTPTPEPLELPGDRPRAPRSRDRRPAASLPFRLGDGTSATLHRLARRRGVSPFMVLLGAVTGFLGRLTGASDLVIGTFVAGRERPEIEPLVGFFVNTLPLRIDLGGEATFATLLDRVRETTLAAYALQSLPFERLLDALDVERSMTRSPLFQVLLVLQNHPLGTVELGGARGHRFGDAQPDTGLDLTWWTEETDGELEGVLEYATDRFDPTTVRRWREGWRRLLEAALESPETPVRSLPLLSAAERHQVTRNWSRGQHLTTREFLACFREQVDRSPDRIALVDAATGASLTYGGLAGRVETLARSLTEQGVGVEDRVLVRLDRSPELITGLLAIHAVGAAWVPVDPTWPDLRVARMADDAGALVTLDGSSWAVEPPSHSRTAAPAARWPPREPESAAYVIYTSGSTGRPKGVVVPRRSLSWYAAAAVRHFRLDPTDRVLQLSSPSFDASVEEIFPTLALGATLVLRDEASASSGSAFYSLCRDHGVTVASTPTAFWHELASRVPPETGFPPALRLVILGGERVRPERVATWCAEVGSSTALVNTYGPTEATVVAILEPIRGVPDAGLEVAIGRPVPGARAYVLDRDMEPVLPGALGELMLGGPGVARGYLGHAAATAAAFVPDPFSSTPGSRLYATGDRARQRADGRIDFRGRVDLQVKIRGFRVEPGEVEDVLGRHPAVAGVAVVARRDAETPFLAAFFETPEPVPEQELRDFLAERLPPWMVPRVLAPVDAVPKTTAGKIDRRRLLDLPLELGGRPDVADYVPPRTPTEEVLAEIWAECLEVEQVGVLDDFFALGGHSLLLTRITARIRETLNVDVPLVTFFEAPTIAVLAREIETSSRPPLPPVERLPRDGRDFPTAFAQERLWFLSQLDPDSGSYHVPRVLCMEGRLSTTALDGAYQEVIRRQEVLRTTFPEKDGRPWQRIHPPPRGFTVPRVDLSGLDTERGRSEAQELMDMLARRTFDLERGPLLRVYLLRMEPRLHRLLQNEHHMVHDGWTEGVLLENVTVLYRAFALGEPSPLEELPFHFADFAAWQRQWLTGEVLDEQVGYWRDHLEGAPALLELPTDRPRPQALSSRGDARNFRMSGELSRAVSALGRRQGTTLFMTMLAAFEAVLVRWSGQSDLVVGTGVANRRHRETERLVGMIINTLALRTDASGDPLFDELLARVRAVCLDAYAHEDLPFEKVVEVMAPERALSHHPLFQVEFAFYNAPHDTEELPGLRLTDEAVHNRSTKWDLLYIVTPPEGERDFTVAHVEWSTDLFDACTIERMFRHFERVLEGVAEDPGIPLSELPLLSAGERHQVSREWSGQGPSTTESFLLHDRFFDRSAQSPDRVALVDGTRHFSYGEIAARARGLARRLQASGVGPEDVVGLYGGRSVETVTAIVGILAAGAAYLPLDPAYPPERLRFALEDSDAAVVVSTQARSEDFPTFPDQGSTTWLRLRDVDPSRDPGVHRVNVEQDGAAYVIYTSGSTGRPKGVVVSHANASRLFSAVKRDFDFGPQDVWSLFHSTAFDFSVWEIWGAFTTGARLVVVPYLTSRSPKETHELLAAERVTVLNQTPSAFLQLQETERQADDDLAALRWIVFGGEALDPAALASWFARHGDGADGSGPTLVNMYGITETTVHVTYRRLSQRDAVEPLGSRVGRPLGDLSTRLLHPVSRQPSPMGVAGEIFVGGAGPARGYLRRPALTAERFVPDPGGEPGARLYRSGDLARFRPPTGELEYLGRIDHQVQLRGFRVELGEIETTLATHPAVAAAVVVPVGTGTQVDRLAAWTRTVAGSAPPDVEELREHLAKRLPSYMVPALYFKCPEFPATPSGKIDRQALGRDSAEAGRTARAQTRHVEPETPTGRALAAMWEEVLGVRRVGLTDDFFALGGHSLLATQILHRIEEDFGVEVPLRRLFESPTLESLEMAVTEAQVARADESEVLALLAQLEETA